MNNDNAFKVLTRLHGLSPANLRLLVRVIDAMAANLVSDEEIATVLSSDDSSVIMNAARTWALRVEHRPPGAADA